MPDSKSTLLSTDFTRRHVGSADAGVEEMLDSLALSSLDELTSKTVPASILFKGELDLPEGVSEHELIARATELASRNKEFKSYIGTGYSGTHTPPVIQRNILENPGWYTQYTPYQAEIAQGRLEALLNFQTMVIDLTGLPIANASLLDEGTAAAEAMTLAHNVTKGRRRFIVSHRCHPQTLEVVRMRAQPLGIEVMVGDAELDYVDETVLGALVQYPTTDGEVVDYGALAEKLHEHGGLLIVAADLMSLALIKAPGEFGADIAVGSTQRFGVPLGYGGPHAAYFACREDYKRRIPGRIIGVSEDANGKTALRMALQTREQHIRREKATSNICTAQVLLAVIAGMYAVYHGPEGIREIARRIHGLTRALAKALESAGHGLLASDFFDTIRIKPADGTSAEAIREKALEAGINLRYFDDGTIGISLDETVTDQDLSDLAALFGAETAGPALSDFEGAMSRESAFMTHPVFSDYQTETELLRYMHRLQARDLSLTTSMIPLGSCTMKLNATAQMVPVTMPGFGSIHPFAPVDQAEGYAVVIDELGRWLQAITGFQATSFQPNSGAQGEYAGLLVIRAYHLERQSFDRNVCLIPSSAHGTNPASAVMAGMKVVIVKSDDRGMIDVDDLKAKAEEHKDSLAALMVTYPSTHGVFEAAIEQICQVVHDNGGLVYMDGANLNAQVGLCRPADVGADVCHINLHKTFSIPHGGGGPGMGPICVNDKLAPFLPGHPAVKTGGEDAIGPVSAAPWGSASILLISWAYIALLGRDGVKHATQMAILNANYMAKRLEGHYDVLYRGDEGYAAHEFIIDLREIKKETGISEVDVAKRLMDYGYHAPTMSWPVPGTMMIEPTESESKAELDRFCDAMISIRAEIQEIGLGLADGENNVLKNAPHTAEVVVSDDWDRPYGREKAAFPAPWCRTSKFWPSVGRVDNALGDRNLVCACLPIEAYS